MLLHTSLSPSSSSRPTAIVEAADLVPGDTITAGFGVYAISWDTERLVRITWTHREVNGDNRAQTLVVDNTLYEVFIG